MAGIRVRGLHHPIRRMHRIPNTARQNKPHIQGNGRPTLISELHSEVRKCTLRLCHLPSTGSTFCFHWAWREGGERELIMLIIICGCDVLKCKAHLNPAANYRMFCGGVSAAEVGLGFSRCLKHKNWHPLNVKSSISGGALFGHVTNKLHK